MHLHKLTSSSLKVKQTHLLPVHPDHHHQYLVDPTLILLSLIKDGVSFCYCGYCTLYVLGISGWSKKLGFLKDGAYLYNNILHGLIYVYIYIERERQDITWPHGDTKFLF